MGMYIYMHTDIKEKQHSQVMLKVAELDLCCDVSIVFCKLECMMVNHLN